MALTNIEIKALEAVSKIPSLIKEQNNLLLALIDAVERAYNKSGNVGFDEGDSGGRSALPEREDD